jgi:hypothetical protein
MRGKAQAPRPMRAYFASQRILATGAPGNAMKLHVKGIRQVIAPEEIGFVAFATAQTGLIAAGGLSWIKITGAAVASFQISRVNGGRPMDRLLYFLLKTFIRRRTFKVTTSRGTVLTFGDGTGQPVSVRFDSRAAEWGILLDPELKFAESYMNGTFVVEQGSIADVLAIALGQKSEVPHWALPQTAALREPAVEPVQPAPVFEAQMWRIITISTDASTRSSSTPIDNTAAPISKTPNSRWTTLNWRRSGTWAPS